MEDQPVPQAVVSDDAAAKLCFFPLGGKVQEPSLQRGVCLSENLMRQDMRKFSHLLGWPESECGEIRTLTHSWGIQNGTAALTVWPVL